MTKILPERCRNVYAAGEHIIEIDDDIEGITTVDTGASGARIAIPGGEADAKPFEPAQVGRRFGRLGV